MIPLNQVYAENEELNNHIENARLVVKAFGTERELDIIERVIKRKGELSSYSLDLYNTILNVARKYEDLRLEKGYNLFLYNDEFIS